MEYSELPRHVMLQNPIDGPIQWDLVRESCIHSKSIGYSRAIVLYPPWVLNPFVPLMKGIDPLPEKMPVSTTHILCIIPGDL